MINCWLKQIIGKLGKILKIVIPEFEDQAQGN